MKFAFVMDAVERINVLGDTTFVFIEECQRRGHTCFMAELSDLLLRGDVARAHLRTIRVSRQAPHFELGPPTWQSLSNVDAVWMRKDPPIDTEYLYATHILDHSHCPVFNRSTSLRLANEKLLAHHFAAFMAPAIVTRDMTVVREFLHECGGRAVIKPLQFSGGSGVFLLDAVDKNLAALIETSTQFGTRYAQVQRYLPAVEAGDKRILLLDGEFLGAVLRVPARGELRGNLHVGAMPVATTLTADEEVLCRSLAPELRALGLMFVGIDVIGGVLTEINITSPTGIQEMNRLYNSRLETAVIDHAEAAVRASASHQAAGPCP